jgi:antirestriction protein ArdC
MGNVDDDVKRVFESVKNYPDPPRLFMTEAERFFYDVKTDTIGMQANSLNFFYIAFHEIVHSTGHPSRLNRNLNGTDSTPSDRDIALEEIIADLGSLEMFRHTGMDHRPYFLPEGKAVSVDAWLRGRIGQAAHQWKVSDSEMEQLTTKSMEAVDYILGRSKQVDPEKEI